MLGGIVKPNNACSISALQFGNNCVASLILFVKESLIESTKALALN